MILLLDNEDSFVHNLARYVRRLGRDTVVRRSHRIDVDAVRDLAPEAIVISPGPRGPAQAGCSVRVIEQLSTRIPILGVCLGHQAIGLAMGATIVRCGPVHGSASEIEHDGRGVFAGCPTPTSVARYHSLAIGADDLPADLTVTARTADGVIMGVRHRSRPLHGIQFHPESVLTGDGERMIENFVILTDRFLNPVDT